MEGVSRPSEVRRSRRSRGRTVRRAGAALVALVAAGALTSVLAPPVYAAGRPARLTSVRATLRDSRADATVPTIAVSPSTAQRIIAIGASGAWWPNTVRLLPDSVQNQVAAMLFGRAGIELSGYRYNIGGGGVGVRNPHHVAQTFLAGPHRYDWSDDPGGVHFLRLAASYHVPVLSGFVNSAPALFKTDHKSCGGSLIPGRESAYASYLATVVAHLHHMGLTLSYVSPMNEPDSSFAHCTQEGMSVPLLERAVIVDALGPALASRAPYARVIADETSQAYSQLLPEAPLWLGAPDVTHWLAAVAHHTYDYPTNAELAAVARLAPRYGVPTWTTEICCYDGKDFGGTYDPTMANGMWLANSIWQDLSVTGDSSFNWWVAVSGKLGCDPVSVPTCPSRQNPKGRNDGLLYFDPNFGNDHNFAIYPTKRFWVLGNFSRYVRPGAVRHLVSSPGALRTVAFSTPRRWTLVVVDEAPGRAGPQLVRVELPRTAGPMSPAGSFVTSSTADLAPRPAPLADRRGGFLAEVDPQSVTTFVFGHKRGTTGAGGGSVRLASTGAKSLASSGAHNPRLLGSPAGALRAAGIVPHGRS
jgi:O-glycosyl hydrolase